MFTTGAATPVMSLTRRIVPLAFRKRPSYPAPSSPPELLPVDKPVEEERVPRYEADTYYPVEIGETIGGRYEVETKLGFGGGSTVWLARDRHRFRWQPERYVALKVCRNDPRWARPAEHEARMSYLTAARIAQAGTSDTIGQFLRLPIDAFEIRGPKYHHRCLVYEPLRECADDLRYAYVSKLLPVSLVQSTGFSLFAALIALHEDARIVHTDLKLENIMYTFESPTILPQFLEFATKNPAPRKYLHDRTIYRSNDTFPGLEASDHHKLRPQLVDLSASTEIVHGTDLPVHVIQPISYRAPEVILGIPWSFSADIWNMGILLWDMIEGRPLSDRQGEDEDEAERKHLALLLGYLGSPPDCLLRKARYTAKFWDEEGAFKYPEFVPTDNLEDIMKNLKGEEKASFLALFRKTLKWDPAERPSAGDLVIDESSWLRYGEEEESKR